MGRVSTAAIARAVLGACREETRLQVAMEVVTELRDPDLGIEVMAAARAIHAHGVELTRVAFESESA